MKGTRGVEHLLLEEDWAEARVEGSQTLSLCDLRETADETGGERRLRHKTNAGGLERAEGNVGEELRKCRGSEVDCRAVLAGRLIAQQRDRLLLEEFVAAELESTLQEIAGEGWAGAGEQGAGTLVGDDLAEATDEATVVGDRIELDARLDAVVLSPVSPCFFAPVDPPWLFRMLMGMLTHRQESARRG